MKGTSKEDIGNKRANKLSVFDGFIKQMPRAFNYLLKGAYTVQIETEDDISVLNENEQVILVEQLKTKKNINVFANASLDLWETLYNWVYNYVNEKNSNKYFNPKFILYSVKKNSIHGTCLDKLLNVGNEETFNDVLLFCEEVLKNSTDKIKKYLEYIKKHKKYSYKVIKNFEVEVPIKTLSEDLDCLIDKIYKDTFNYPDAFMDFTNQLYGWYYKLIANREGCLLENCRITQAEFEKFKAIYNGRLIKIKYKQGTLTKNEVEELERELFVEQLNAIGASNEVTLIAKRSYTDWKNCEEKDLLNGMISQEVLEQTYSNLNDNWVNEKSNIPKQTYSTETEQGKYLYNKVQEHNVFIDGVELQGDKKSISRGAYNYLANRDITEKYSIGWHSNYKELFKNWRKHE